MATFSDTITANGTYGPFFVKGQVHLKLADDFGGGSVQVNERHEESNTMFALVEGGPFTAAIDKRLDFSPDETSEIELVVSGATAPSLKYQIKCR